MGRIRALVVACALLVLGASASARAEFPYQPQGSPDQYERYFLPASEPRPNDLAGKLTWMYASTAEPGSPLAFDARELNGVRGAHLVDADAAADQAWHTTTGRPDVAIGVTDSGIEWNNDGAMSDLRKTTRIARGETPVPNALRTTSIEDGSACSAYGAAPDRDPRDLNRDGVFNIIDYACDDRVRKDDPRNVNPDVFEPQDVLIAFTDGDDDDGNGYADDMVGWDFLDDDNDPFDDVQYGHGTGESIDSFAEADTGGDKLGTCPNCMGVHLRVGTSFIADVNRFAEAVVYATDNDILVVQDALGTLNKSAFALDAIKYAYDHGTTVIASAADEAAQHHNQPSSLPYSIVVNSVTHFDEADALPGPSPVSYLQFNGCTNFSSRITLAIPSVSCSSDATGRAAGMAGLIYAAAINARAAGRLQAHPTCKRPDGTPCVVTPNEVRQLMASGIDGTVPVADDVNFAQTPTGQSTEGACQPLPAPGCTNPFFAAPTRPGTPPRSYPARKGHDQFYGYGRVNMDRAVDLVDAARIPPEVEVESPNWFDMVDPDTADLQVAGTVDNRGGAYSCEVFVAPGSYAGEKDFVRLPSGHCDGSQRSGAFDGVLASLATDDLEALFPPGTDFRGREPGPGPQTSNGRPANEPHGFVVKAIVTAGALKGQDRRQAYLHRDADMLEGFPRQLAGDVEASPVLADVDGDNENELVLANSDGEVHVFERTGGESEGWPRTTGPVRPGHLDGHPVDSRHEAVIATPAVADLDRDGTLEIVVADLDRHVRVFNHDGTLERDLVTSARFAGIPQAPFANIREGSLNRVQPGFIASPVLADVAGDAKLEIVAAAMDRHVYAWHEDGTPVAGWPALVVDRTKVASIDPDDHTLTFKPDAAAENDQGAIIDTPAVGDITGDGRPEVVVGTNESYAETINAGSYNEAEYAPLGAALSPGNGRLFALKPTGLPDNLALANDGYLPGWPFKVGILQRGLLPLVGEGITGAPVIGSVPCGGPTASVRVGTIPAAGLAYLVNPDGRSCYGQTNGKDVALPSSGGLTTDPIFLAAVGHPAFGTLAGKPSFLAPAAGVVRASDVVLPEYQGGNDYLVAWDTASGQVAPGWPAQVNDLQFLTGPSLADLDGLPGSEVAGGTANGDLYGLTGAGTPIDTGWPKLTGDWTVSNPAIGTWGAGPTKVLVSGTRSGRLLAYETGASACASAEWPQFHHDPANSGDARRDAVSPGRPTAASLDGATLRFTATGDDLLCGAATAYEIVTSPDPITPGNFAGATRIPASQTPQAVGSAESVPLTGALQRYVAVRAVDEQGNVGRPAVVDRVAGPQPTATPTTSPAATSSPTVTATATASPTAAPCVDTTRPFSKFVRRRLTRTEVDIAGRTFEPGCARMASVRVAVGRKMRRGGCRWLREDGALGRRRSCRRPAFLDATGGRPWRLQRSARLPRGRYVLMVRAADTAGNAERPSRSNRRGARVK